MYSINWSRRKSVKLLFSVFLACWVAACSRPSSPLQENAEVKIGFMAPFSGPLDFLGESSLNAANLAVQEFNAADGLEIDGQRVQVVLVVEDSQADPEVSVRLAKKLIDEDKVAALIGPQISGTAIPVAEMVEAARVPMIAPISSNPETTRNKRYVYRVIAPDSFQGKVVAQFAYAELAVRRAAVLYDEANPYSSTLAEIFRQTFEEQGGRVVAFEAFNTDEQDYGRQLEQIQAGQPELVFLPNFPQDVPAQVRQARDLGITAIFMGSDTWYTIESEERAQLEGMFFTASWSPDAASELAQAFIGKYQQTYGSTPDDVAALNYDALYLLFQAIRSQKSIARDSILKGLAITEPFEGVTGGIEYLGDGDPIRSIMVLRIEQGENVFYQLVRP